MGAKGALTALAESLSPVARRLHNAIERGARYVSGEDTRQIVPVENILHRSPNSYGSDAQSLDRSMAIGALGHSPTMTPYDYMDRLERAADQGFVLPAWRALASFPKRDSIDRSFLEGIGAHIDLTPSGYASRLYAADQGYPFDLSPSITGFKGVVGDQNPFLREMQIHPRIMSQVAVRPSKNTLLVTDAEANDPGLLANILGEKNLFKGIYGENDRYIGKQQKWQRLLDEFEQRDMGLLYPNTGEIVFGRKQGIPSSRVSRTYGASTGITPDMTLEDRLNYGQLLMSNPWEMRRIGNPSYVVTDPRNMRDLNLGTFTRPHGMTVYDKEGGLIRANR